jgi:hypothetical protein
MPSDFARRQNTDGWWRIHLNRVIEDGEELRQRGCEKLRSFEDLQKHQEDIDGWLQNAASEIRTIYSDPSVAAEYCQPVAGVDLHALSRSDILNSFRNAVDERIRGLRGLIDGGSH